MIILLGANLSSRVFEYALPKDPVPPVIRMLVLLNIYKRILKKLSEEKLRHIFYVVNIARACLGSQQSNFLGKCVLAYSRHN